MTFAPGQAVGEYEIVRLLGSGGLGTVYEAKHVISRRAEAMKVLLPAQTRTPEMIERFRREIQMLASLNHPNIAGLHHAFYADEQLVMIMELVDGEDLRTYGQRNRIELPVLIYFASQVLAALEYAHGRGVVHRDIKPANIMVAANGTIKVLDFGIAISERSEHLTAVGALIGSLTHISPEQLQGKKATPQSDIYALGVTLYELASGQLPIEGKTTYQLMMAHLNQVPIPLTALRPEMPGFFSDAVAKALEKQPANRFASASEFLGAILSGDVSAPSAPVIAEPKLAVQQPNAEAPRRPTMIVEALPLDRITQHLASFIGPIAKIVVQRLVKQHTDTGELYLAAARQIDDEDDRERFLRTRPR